MTPPSDEVKDLGPDAGKAAWRAWARTARRGLGPEVAGLVVAGLAGWLAGAGPTTVLAYRAMAGEVPLDTLVAGDRRHRWATTRTPDTGGLTVHAWDAPTEPHRFGFDQPVAGAAVVGLDEVGVVLVPGLVFDLRGGRLGHGKGYYDRLLAALPGAVAVGVTTDAFVVPVVPTDRYDVPMAWLASESGVWRVTPG